jgi:hypothetical protein
MSAIHCDPSEAVEIFRETVSGKVCQDGAHAS